MAALVRRRLLLTAALAALPLDPRAAPALPEIRGFRNPGCACCEGWAEHLRASGFSVAMQDAPDLARVRQQAGVPAGLEGCHTAFAGGLVIEGHVPAEAVKRLLAEPGALRGIAVPGMPVGSPGMEVSGEAPAVYEIWAFDAAGRRRPFSRAQGSALLPA